MYDNVRVNNVKFNKGKLRDVLRQRNLNNTQAAKELGISKDTFTNYYRGRVPKTEYLYIIAKFFNKDMEWFLTEEEHEHGEALVANEEPVDDSSDDISFEEMCEILERLMSDEDPNLRGWAVVQFREAFGKYCRKPSGVKETFARYMTNKKNIQ